MKFVVLNGSPKGEMGISIQYLRYIARRCPEHDFVEHHVGMRIKRLEKRESAFDEVIADIRDADGVLWVTPVYCMMAPAQLKRFIELIHERQAANAFAGKYAAILTTSLRFFDHTAFNYLHAISEDMGMHVYGRFSAEMNDLKQEAERMRLRTFFDGLFSTVAEQRLIFRQYAPLHPPTFTYSPDAVAPVERVDARGKNIIVVYDDDGQSPNLAGMVSRFTACFAKDDVTLLRIQDLNLLSGCIGCLKCAYDNQCVFEGKDGFVEFFRDTVAAADILVYAGAMKDRFLSANWKMMIDRSFFMGHTPTATHKQYGFIFTGPLRQEANLQQFWQAYVEIGVSNTVSIVTDEECNNAAIDQSLQTMATQLVHQAELGYIAPPTFLKIGGMKVFRDEIWGGIRAVFIADYRSYKRMGLFDFPKRSLKQNVIDATLSLLMRSARFRKTWNRNIKRGMMMALEKIVNEA